MLSPFLALVNPKPTSNLGFTLVANVAFSVSTQISYFEVFEDLSTPGDI